MKQISEYREIEIFCHDCKALLFKGTEQEGRRQIIYCDECTSWM